MKKVLPSSFSFRRNITCSKKLLQGASQFFVLLFLFCIIAPNSSSWAQTGIGGSRLQLDTITGSGVNQKIPGQYIVVLKENSMTGSLKDKPYAERQRLMKDNAASILRQNNLQGKIILNVYGTALKGFSVSDLSDADVQKLRQDASVAYVEQDQLISINDNGNKNQKAGQLKSGPGKPYTAAQAQRAVAF